MIGNHPYQVERESVINFIAKYNLQLLLPQGTITYQ